MSAASGVKIGLLFGGASGEHEVSLRSAQAIARALSGNGDKYAVYPFYIAKDGTWRDLETSARVLASGQPLQLSGPQSVPALGGVRVLATPETSVLAGPAGSSAAEIQVWFPVLHGPNGEDGTVQGLLSLMGQPFVGAGVLASAVGMDKIAMKTLFAAALLPQVRYLTLSRHQWQSQPGAWLERLQLELGYPCFVKPANLGSSVGIAKARNRAQLEAALDSASSYDRRLIVEASVGAREIECAVLGNDEPRASVLGEIRYQSDFYDYETKYTEGLAELIIPAELPEALARQVQQMSIRAFQAIDGAGLARVDFFYVEATGEVLINEINTMPGFTATSMYPQLWQASGVGFAELVDQLVQLALERHT